ncbi:MAG: glycosyl transferase family 1, partial [Deltaproteobacteria bacterium]|nr:glycosyl transferase family 1 [Deltaproteobacteria bacterium]
FFNSSDLVVLPYHRFDSQSGVGAISISFRKTLIVTRVGGLPDLVTDSRCVVPPKDTQALTKAITVCLGNPDHMKSMSLSADEIAKDLSWPAIAKKTCEVYDQLIQFSANLKTS